MLFPRNNIYDTIRWIKYTEDKKKKNPSPRRFLTRYRSMLLFFLFFLRGLWISSSKLHARQLRPRADTRYCLNRRFGQATYWYTFSICWCIRTRVQELLQLSGFSTVVKSLAATLYGSPVVGARTVASTLTFGTYVHTAGSGSPSRRKSLFATWLFFRRLNKRRENASPRRATNTCETPRRLLSADSYPPRLYPRFPYPPTLPKAEIEKVKSYELICFFFFFNA